jgi:hypothetical protein
MWLRSLCSMGDTDMDDGFDDIDIDTAIDWVDGGVEGEDTSRARARRMLAEQMRWLNHYENPALTDPVWRARYREWAEECRINIERLKAGEFGNVVPVKAVKKPRAKKLTLLEQALADRNKAKATKALTSINVTGKVTPSTPH